MEAEGTRKAAGGSAKPGRGSVSRSTNVSTIFAGLGSRAASKVTFLDTDTSQPTRAAAGEHRGSTRAPQPQLSELKKKDEINPFKFSADVDFCALSQLDKREKAQVTPSSTVFSNPLSLSQERERMQNLKVHEKLSKAQRLMQGRRFRVLKEIDDDIEREVRV